MLKLHPPSHGICHVLTTDGLHVGNLKLINGQWKFKAVGYGEHGEVIPGGGPLTAQHNTVFAVLDERVITQTLLLAKNSL